MNKHEGDGRFIVRNHASENTVDQIFRVGGAGEAEEANCQPMKIFLKNERQIKPSLDTR